MVNKRSFKQRFSRKNRGGTMRIFGDELNPAVPYKTFLLSTKDTAQWVVKEMLEKYGLKGEDPQKYCLLQIFIPTQDHQTIKETILHDQESPYLNYIQNSEGSCVFKVIKHSTEDRMMTNELFMFIEVNHDNTNLPTPRVYKLHSNTTCVGSDINARNEKQYFYIDGIGVDGDHCTIQNDNGMVGLIPNGDVCLNGKLMSKPFALQHGAFLCFGQNSTFRYYDSQSFRKSPSLKNESKRLANPENVLPSIDYKVNILPGLLAVPFETESRFLHAVFGNSPLLNIHFRLSPVYALYMILRHRLSPHGTANIPYEKKLDDVVSLLDRIENFIKQKTKECERHAEYLAYWLANTSELVYFLKHDRDFSKISPDIQSRLIQSIEQFFASLVQLFQKKLDKYLIALTNADDDNEQKDSEHSAHITFDRILKILSFLMDVVRKCRVNPALTIQIFSQIFHYINTWLFNRVVCCPELNLCSSKWGERWFFRLKLIDNWAQRQGLEIASECHLTKVKQLCLLLKSSKNDGSDVQKLISNDALKINSMQIRQILKNYVCTKHEPPISKDFSQALLSAASQYVDGNLHPDGFIIQLAEESNLNLPFLLPEDGYTCENLCGIPQQLIDFIEPIHRLGLCRLFINPYSLGTWTEFLQISDGDKIDSNARLETVVVKKKENSLGLSIVSAKNDCQRSRGIYIKEILSGGAADEDGRLHIGDQILSVDRIDLIDKSQEQAAEVLKQCRQTLTLKILKNAAVHHGFSPLFTHPSFVSEQHLSSRKRLPINPPQRSSSLPKSSYSSELSIDKQSNLYTSENLSTNGENHSIRSTDRNRSNNQLLISREDIPSGQHETHSIDYTKFPSSFKTYSKPTIVPFASIRQADSVRRKPRIEQQDKAGQSINTNEIRSKRVHEFISPVNHADLQLEDFRNSKFGDDSNGYLERFSPQTNTQISLSSSDEMNEFDEKLKRRLEQFEHDREIERAHIHKMLTKREAEIEGNIRKNREREIRADQDKQDFLTRRLTKEDQILEAKKEQTRLLKHIVNKRFFPKQ